MKLFLSSAVFIYLLVCLFIYYLLANDLFIWGGRGRERGKERILSRLGAQHGARSRAQSCDPEIRTWAETKSPTVNWLCHPGALAIFNCYHVRLLVCVCLFGLHSHCPFNGIHHPGATPWCYPQVQGCWWDLICILWPPIWRNNSQGEGTQQSERTYRFSLDYNKEDTFLLSGATVPLENSLSKTQPNV